MNWITQGTMPPIRPTITLRKNTSIRLMFWAPFDGSYVKTVYLAAIFDWFYFLLEAGKLRVKTRSPGMAFRLPHYLNPATPTGPTSFLFLVGVVVVNPNNNAHKVKQAHYYPSRFYLRSFLNRPETHTERVDLFSVFVWAKLSNQNVNQLSYFYECLV